MSQNMKVLPIALRMIFKDPINFSLTIIPTLISLALYFILITAIFKNMDVVAVSLRDYIHSPETAGLVGKFLTALMIIFVLFIMSWTFVIVVGIIAAPINSMISSRIEKKLTQQVVEHNKSKTIKEITSALGETFKNEAKKLVFILILSVLAVLMNFFPFFYPVALFLFSVLIAIQFLDYSWSRHDLSFGACLKDIFRNLFSYGFAGFFFLLLVTIPVINAFIPALATSYFTVLWLQKQNKIKMINPPQ